MSWIKSTCTIILLIENTTFDFNLRQGHYIILAFPHPPWIQKQSLFILLHSKLKQRPLMNRETGETDVLSHSKPFSAIQNKEQFVYNESNFYINNRVAKD